MPKRTTPVGNLQTPWRGVLTQEALTRRQGQGSIWSALASENVRRNDRGRLKPRSGFVMLDYELTALAGVTGTVEGIWPLTRFGQGITPELVHYWDRNFYHATPALRSGAITSVSATDPSEGANTLASYFDSSTATVDDNVLIPPSAAIINRYICIVNGWGVNQANYGGGWVRQCIQPPPDPWQYGAFGIFTRMLGLPDDYRLGVRVFGSTFGSPPVALRPPNTWRVWAAYFDSDTGRYSNPCSPLVLWSYLPTIIGGGAPSAGLRYETTGSDDPAVDEIHWFRSTANGTQGYLVATKPNASGLVQSDREVYQDEELFALPQMEKDNYPAPIARYAHVQKGTVFLGGGFDINLAGATAQVRLGSRTVVLSQPAAFGGLNESFVGTAWRFDASPNTRDEVRTYYCKRVTSAYEFELTEDYAGADATRYPRVDGFDDVVRWNAAPWLHKWPAGNQIVIRGEASGEGPQGPITGFGEHGGATLIFQRRQGWRLDWSSSPDLRHGAYLNRVPGLSGCVSDRTFIRFGDNLCGWLGEDGWVMYDGVKASVITDNRLQDFMKTFHKASMGRSWAVHLRAERSVIVGVRIGDPVSPETVAGWPDRYLSIDYTTGDWDIHDDLGGDVGAACVVEIENEEHVIMARSGALPPPMSFGRGYLDGVTTGVGLDLDGTVDSMFGSLQVNVAGTLIASPGLRGAKVEFTTGALQGRRVEITDSSATSFTVDTAGAAQGDTYRIGYTHPRARYALPVKRIENAEQCAGLTLQFEVQNREVLTDNRGRDIHDHEGKVLLANLPGASQLHVKLYRNGQVWPLDSDDENNLTAAGWRILDGEIIVDMEFVNRSADALTTLRMEMDTTDDFDPTDVLEIEFTAELANQTWAVVAFGMDVQELAN